MSKPMQTPISIILVTYNRQSLLRRMLDCILAQSFTDYELILIDNGSTDGTADICQAYARKDARIRLQRIAQNKGASNGRNAGLSMARGEYIAMVDDDDWCEASMIGFLWELAQEYEADIAICGSYYDFSGKYKPKYVGTERHALGRLDALRALLLREQFNVAPPAKLFKRSLWEGLTFPDGVLVDDIHVVYKAFERAKRVAVHNEPFYYFNRHGDNMTAFNQSKRLTPQLLDEYMRMYDTRAQFLLGRAPELADVIAYSLHAYMLAMCTAIQANGIEGCQRPYASMMKRLEQGLPAFRRSGYLKPHEKDDLRRLGLL